MRIHRSAMITAGIAVAGMLAGYSVIRVWGGGGERRPEFPPGTIAPFDERPGEGVAPWINREVYTSSYNAMVSFITSDLVRREVWDVEEAAFVADLMSRPSHPETDNVHDLDAYPISVIEDLSLGGEGLSLYGARVQRRHAVTERARAVLDPLVIGGLGDPSSLRRISAVNACFHVGLSDREDVRRHLVRMMTEDPDIRVRKVLERKFKVEDYFRAMREGRPWTPPKKAGAT
ncbi:MAG: hypothetical protein HRU70_10050 [Phycisphaeraceae bacterium]|nr:MAG: hypothetical protein HRU70_10050 [Phycisphaeraceae bacterium]